MTQQFYSEQFYAQEVKDLYKNLYRATQMIHREKEFCFDVQNVAVHVVFSYVCQFKDMHESHFSTKYLMLILLILTSLERQRVKNQRSSIVWFTPPKPPPPPRLGPNCSVGPSPGVHSDPSHHLLLLRTAHLQTPGSETELAGYQTCSGAPSLLSQTLVHS